jgi:two-component system response regulator
MNKKMILLVEDRQDDIDLTLQSFKNINIANRIDVVRDGAEALDYIFATGAYSDRDIEDLPAVILLDIKLPKVDGMEVLRRIREDERTKTLPVVILTSSKEEKDLIEGYKIGCNSYVRKPVEFENFSKAISELGLYWLLLNEPPPIKEVK